MACAVARCGARARASGDPADSRPTGIAGGTRCKSVAGQREERLAQVAAMTRGERDRDRRGSAAATPADLLVLLGRDLRVVQVAAALASSGARRARRARREGAAPWRSSHVAGDRRGPCRDMAARSTYSRRRRRRPRRHLARRPATDARRLGARRLAAPAPSG